ncbi:hypothetical protein ONZ51_g2008 [Trametes cubensis]|uniref:Uncharacterized protein n=1 Tax=Trametes cubensis TaxID=1111947 RepID=A0AAD7XEB4_9APHY|nr:hypothetical protein ONZ51_g2008 [Trametes cubensis]
MEMSAQLEDGHGSYTQPSLNSRGTAVLAETPFTTSTTPDGYETITPTPTNSFVDGISFHAAPCPTKPPGPPNVVHVVIHTTVTIPDFSQYYTVPIAEFRPSYVALSDGSLVSPVFTPNLKVSESWLVMGGALCMFFFINTYKSVWYCRIVNVKNKSLFYMLVASQFIGLFVSVFFLVADFDLSVDCTATGMIKKGGVLLSTTLLVPGILGTKAYRCLSNAGFVVVFLVLIRATIIAVSGIILVEYRGGRRFTGTCETTAESTLLPVSVALQFVESAFICSCFMWAVYRSYRSPADHARLSLTVQDDETSTIDMPEKEDSIAREDSARRGWWDYVPDANETKSRSHVPFSPALSTPKDWVNRFRQWWTGEPVLPSTVFQRKPSTPGEFPIPQPRISSASGANALSLRLSTSREGMRPSSPPPPSVMERIIRYVPRADLFRKMLKNELLYTTLLTAILLVIAIVMWVGITRHLLLGANTWIMIDWVIISLCTMHSFSRVAHRHEREAWLQDPANWRSFRQSRTEVEVEAGTSLHPKNSRRAWSPVSVSSDWRRRHRQHGDSDGPYSISRYTYPDPPADPLSLPGPSRMRSTSFSRSHEGANAASRSTSVVSSPMRSVDSVFRPPHAPHGSPMILPSPECPSTSVSTPHTSDSHAMLSGPLPPSRSPYRGRGRSCSAPRESRSRSASPRRGARRCQDPPENLEPPDPGSEPRR